MAEECTMNFLCKVIQTIPVFDFQMFLGEIEAVYVNEECMTNDKPDPLKINPLMMMGSNYYDLGKDVGTLFKTGLEILPKQLNKDYPHKVVLLTFIFVAIYVDNNVTLIKQQYSLTGP